MEELNLACIYRASLLKKNRSGRETPSPIFFRGEVVCTQAKLNLAT